MGSERRMKHSPKLVQPLRQQTCTENKCSFNDTYLGQQNKKQTLKDINNIFSSAMTKRISWADSNGKNETIRKESKKHHSRDSKHVLDPYLRQKKYWAELFDETYWIWSYSKLLFGPMQKRANIRKCIYFPYEIQQNKEKNS